MSNPPWPPSSPETRPDARAAAARAPGAPAGGGLASPLDACAGAARAALTQWASSQAGVLAAHRAGVAAGSVEAVHRSRVAVRRLRSLFGVFAALITEDAHLPADLRRLGLALGEARDADVWAEQAGVLLAELGPDADAGVRAELLADTASRRRDARAGLLIVWDGPWHSALVERLEAWAADPRLAPAADAPAAVALAGPLADAVARVSRRAERAARHREDPDAWHDVRKAAKGVRYGYEVAAAAFPGRAAAWEAVTEAFGDLQDASVARARLAGLGGTGTWGVLLATQDDRAAAALSAGRTALAQALTRT